MADEDLLDQLHPNRRQLLHNAQANLGPSRVVPPRSTTSFLLQPPNTPAHNNNTVPRNNRIPGQQQYVPSPFGTYNQGYPNRPYSNFDAYNPYNTFRKQLPPFQNPIFIAASENARPTFEQIYSVLESFNSVSMMLESTFSAMHMSYNSVLAVADNFSRLKAFIMKIYSAIVSVRLARWFLTKIMHLLRMVNGNKKMDDEESVWASLSTTGSRGNNTEQSWPLVLCSGMLVAIPCILYKLIISKMSNSVTSKEVLRNTETFSFKSVNNWDNQSRPHTIPLVKGRYYGTNNAKLALSYENGGWLFVEDETGQKGYVPVKKLVNLRSGNTQLQPITPVITDATPQSIQTVNQNDVIREQIQQPLEDELEDHWN